MGTNYYIRKNICPHCGNWGEEYHIGKSNDGWCFSLHVDPINEIDDLYDVLALYGEIFDDYGMKFTKEEMRKIITDRSWHRATPLTQKWLDDNHAELGPFGLVRYKIDGKHCVGHGEGTWDLIIGEFS